MANTTKPKTLTFDSKIDAVALYKILPEIIVIAWQGLSFNPLEVPPGVQPKIWMNHLVDLFCGVFFIGDVGYQILLEAIDSLYSSLGVYQGKQEFPTLRCLRRHLSKKLNSPKTLRNREALGSLINRLDGLLTTFGEGLDYHRGYCVPEIVSGHVVLTTNGLASQHAGFLIALIVSWTYAYHEANNLRGDFLRVAFIVDEAEPVFGKEVRKSLGRLPVLFQLIPRLREFGIGLVVATQRPRGLDDSILSFAQTKVIKNLVDAQDTSFIGRSVGFNDDQLAFCRAMKPNEGVVFISGRQPDPVLVQIPDFPLDKSVDWSHVHQTMEPRLKQMFSLHPASSTPAPTQAKPHPPAPTSSSASSSASSSSPSTSQQSEIQSCLLHVYNLPFLTKSERLTALFGSSASKQQKIAKTCLDEGYVTEHDIHAGGRSGVVKLWQLTDKGRSFIGVSPKPLPGRGDLTHQYLQHKVSEKLKAWGFKPKTEAFRAGKNVDVGTDDHGKALAFEVATTPGNEATNLLKDVDAGFHHVVILPINETVKKAVQRTLKRQISPSYLNKCSIVSIPDFLRASKPPW